MDMQTIAPEVQTTEVEVQTTSPPPSANGDEPVRAAELNTVRELVLKAHPDVVPDLIAGSSVDELVASVEPARTAYQRIADQVREASSREGEEARSREERDASSTPSLVQPPAVPAGGAATVVDPGDLAPTSKIAQALAARKKR
ncbi:MAG: hypothetical protein K0S99_2078 [Thermomicrobiales bacterium]|nr:hypothetical protein [Thermomicrobiales bacterium]